MFTISKMSNTKLRTIDLFAGIGGIRKGFEATGRFDTVYANDNNKYCKTTYDYNFDEGKLTVADIRDISRLNGNVPDFDFLIGGFPCQAFSIAGLAQGFNDAKGRGTLIDEIIRLLVEQSQAGKKATGFMLENVRNLQDHDGGRTYRIIRERLEGAGYVIDQRVYNSLNFGVPQSRQRIYIVGFATQAMMDCFEWPEPGPVTRLRVRDILETNVDPKHYYEGKPLHARIKDEVTNTESVYAYRRNYIREHKTGFAPTLVASMGQGGHNVPIIKDSQGIRKLTPKECARLQGYDDLRVPHDLSDPQIYKQIGNSVTVPVCRAVASSIIKAVDLASAPSVVKIKVLQATT